MHRATPASLLVLAMAGAPEPAAAQDARACADEVQRLAEGFGLNETTGQVDAAIAQEPSAREGASLQRGQRQQLGDLIQQARTAGERGDSQVCLQRLTEARVILRQAGVGSVQPGLTTDASPGTGTTGSGSAGAAGAGGAGSSTTGASGLAPGSAGGTGGGAFGGTGGTAGGVTGGSSGGSSGGSGGGGS